MERIIQAVADANAAVNDFIWGPVMLVLLVGTGVYFTARTGFLQFRKFGYIIKNTLGTLFHRKKRRESENISPFQALTTALAGTVGTGNIVGVATALCAGGPGAIFWMWISALFGMMTKFSEILLAVKFRETDREGRFIGGPMYYIEKGLHQKWLAVIFAVLGLCACFGIGSMTQVNSIAQALESAFRIPRPAVGAVVLVLVALIIMGGIKRIAKITEKLVPFMALFYIGASLVLIVINAGALPQVFGDIFRGAFTPTAAAGGVAGAAVKAAIQKGIARGVFSNEAGLGSAPMAHAAAETDHPVEQAMWGVFEVFVDTIVVCTCTALVILTTGVLPSGREGVDLTIAAFATVMGDGAGVIVSIALFFFAFSTIIGWSYYGERCMYYLTGGKYTAIFKVIFLAAVFFGATINLELAWDIGDTLNGMMAIPNLVGLLGLSGIVIHTTNDYFRKKDSLR